MTEMDEAGATQRVKTALAEAAGPGAKFAPPARVVHARDIGPPPPKKQCRIPKSSVGARPWRATKTWSWRNG